MYHLCSELPLVGVVMGGRRRGEVEIIRDVLEVCLGGACKTKIVYRANLNFSRLDRYLGLLLGLGFLAAEDDGSGVLFIGQLGLEGIFLMVV